MATPEGAAFVAVGGNRRLRPGGCAMDIEDLAIEGIELEFPLWILVDRRGHGPEGFPFGLHVIERPDRRPSEWAVFTDEDLAQTYKERLGIADLWPLRIGQRKALQNLVGYFLITGGEYVRIDPDPRTVAGRWTAYVGDFLAAFRVSHA